MEKYSKYSRAELSRKIEFLESENKFLKAFIKETQEFKDFNRFIEDEFGGKE